MNKSYSNLEMPNVLLVAGNGRNVGKTYFTCEVIKHLTKSVPVSAIKISSHFHSYDKTNVIFENEKFVVIEEKQISPKDSSLMLQAGAENVYFIMAEQEHLGEAFSKLQPLLPNHAIVCESGGLHQLITPGVFFFINMRGKKIEKKHHLIHNPITVTNDGRDIDFDMSRLQYSNKQFRIA